MGLFENGVPLKSMVHHQFPYWNCWGYNPCSRPHGFGVVGSFGTWFSCVTWGAFLEPFFFWQIKGRKHELWNEHMIDIYLENIMGRTIIGLLFLTMGTQRWTHLWFTEINKNPPIGNGRVRNEWQGVFRNYGRFWQSGRQPLSFYDFYVADSYTFECLWLIAYGYVWK